MLSHFRRALAARREIASGLHGSFRWRAAPAGVLAYQRGALIVACNFRQQSVRLPIEGRLLVASNPRVDRRSGLLELPANSAAWLSFVAA